MIDRLRFSTTRVPFWILMVSALVWACNPARAEEPGTPVEKEIRDRVGKDYPHLDGLYRHFHAHPELAEREERTAARLAAELRQAGLKVIEKIGGHGLAGIFHNGKGPVVMVRADMDGLPIVENTGLPFASKEIVRDDQGNQVGVMHACGHDVNMTCLVGLARLMVALKDRWRGTLICLGQPAEETGQGARLMLEDGLFRRIPRPDFAFALHCDGRFPHGTVNFRSGQMQAHVDSLDIVVRGKGGHGAAPHTTIDPIVLAARIVLDLQTIVSRERDPLDPAVVTVGSIHGGTKHNIIPAEVKMQLTVRTTTDRTRKEVLEAIVRLTKSAAAGARAPEPTIRHDPQTWTPSLYNDPELTRHCVDLLRQGLGKQNILERPMSMGGEDFSRFVREGIKGFYFHIGCVPPDRYREALKGGRPLAPTHSPGFHPVPEPTIRTGVTAMALIVLDRLQP